MAMQRNLLLDTSLTGSPFHTLRAFLWNVRTLGPWSWLRCCIENVIDAAIEASGRMAFPVAALQEADARARTAHFADGRGRD
jgi:hypothetical protein